MATRVGTLPFSPMPDTAVEGALPSPSTVDVGETGIAEKRSVPSSVYLSNSARRLAARVRGLVGKAIADYAMIG